MQSSWVIAGVALAGAAIGGVVAVWSTLSSAEDVRNKLIDADVKSSEAIEKEDETAYDAALKQAVEAAAEDPTAIGPWTITVTLLGVGGLIGGIAAAAFGMEIAATAAASMSGAALAGGAMAGMKVDDAHAAAVAGLAQVWDGFKEALPTSSAVMANPRARERAQVATMMADAANRQKATPPMRKRTR